MRIFKKTYQPLTDEKLILELGKGNHDAFTELYQRYSKPLYQYFYMRMWKDAEKAEDFVQDLMIKIIHHPESFDVTRSFKTWLFSIANNMIKNEYKKQQVRTGTQSIETEREVHTLGSFATERTVDDEFFKQALESKLMKLDEKHKEVFELRHVLGFSNREIADMMGLNEGTVKSRLFYALKQLSDQLIDYKPTF